MKLASVAGVWALCLGLSVGCGGRDDAASQDQRSANETAGQSRPVEVTGCLTARGDQFVLTDLERAADQGNQSAAGEAQQGATESYQLVGNTDDLRPHVGKQVRVVGEAEPQQVAEVRESSPAAGGATGTTGQQGQAGQPAQSGQPAQGNQPQVHTETETRMEVATLRVQSVRPSGASCAAETMGGATPQPRRQ